MKNVTFILFATLALMATACDDSKLANQLAGNGDARTRETAGTGLKTGCTVRDAETGNVSLCVDWAKSVITDAQFQEACTADEHGGIFEQHGCSDAKLVGICTLPENEGGQQRHHFYAPLQTADDARMACAALNGTFQ